jgi:hypothetical protein
LSDFTLQLRRLLTRAARVQPWPVSFGEAGGAERVFASVKCGRLDPSGDFFSFSACRVMLWRSFFSVALTDDGCELSCSPVSLVPPLPPPSYRIFQSCVHLGRSQRRQIGVCFCRCNLSSTGYRVLSSSSGISHAVKWRTL